MSPDGKGQSEAKRAFDDIVARKIELGLRRVRRWDYWDIDDDLDDNPVLKAVYDETDRVAAQEILRQISQPSAHSGRVQLTPLAQLDTDLEATYRVNEVMPTDGNVLIVAQRKAGKTVLALNLAQAILEGTDFLGKFSVTAATGSVAFFNYELSPHMFAAWSRGLGLPEDRFLVANMRGRGNPLRTSETRAALVEVMRKHAVEVLVIDPFSVAFTGQDANSPSEVRTWLTEMEDWFRGDAGGREIILTAHAGWSSDSRARGASSLEDWPDSIITLRSQGPSGQRTLAVRGRDVAVDPVVIEIDPGTRSLRVGGTRGEDVLHEECLKIIRDEPGLNTEQIAAALRSRGVRFRKGEENRALRSLIESGEVDVRLGAKQARLHYPA